VSPTVRASVRGSADDPAMTHRPCSTSSRSLLARLHREWQVIAVRPSVLRRARTWDLGVPFYSLDDIIAATGYWAGRDARLASAVTGNDELRADAEDRANEVMARLLLASRVDEVAARVVLQRLLPGLIARAWRWSVRPAGGTDALDELLAAAWTVIRTFPVERRPGHLVSNLLRGAEYHAFVRPHRRLLVHEFVPTHTLDRPAPEPTVDAAEELAELVDGSRTLTDRDRRLLELLVGGASMHEIATTLDVCVRTVTNHRDAVVHRLRQVAADAAVA
jgi:DNA-directed RNA polymerase specialized sigma24 family protein